MPCKSKKPLTIQFYTTLFIFCVLLVVGCNASICQYCVDRIGSVENVDTAIFTDFVPLSSPPSSKSPIPEGTWRVARIIDGDTIIVLDDEDVEHRVRLVGVDAPEIRPLQPFGQEAKDFAEKMITAAGGYVRLQFDGDETDRSGRVRAHIYLTMPDGTEVWLNNALVLEGLAVSVLGFRYSDGAKKIFVQSEIEARRNSRNMWSESSVGNVENEK